MLPLRQWSGHSLGQPLRLGLRRPLGPRLRLEPLQGLSRLGEQRFGFLCSALPR